MPVPTGQSNSVRYQPALAWFAAIGSFWVFVLMMLGAFTTSIGAGMAFPDWPLSNGSLDPSGWLSNLAMFSEHSHRLSAGLMSTITIILCVWIWRREPRQWLRLLAAFAVALVFFQAIVGGLRVLLDGVQSGVTDTSVGRLCAMLHGCLAQIFVCTLLVIAVALSRPWIEGRATATGPRLRRLGLLCCGLLLVQLAVAAVMRHSFAGLAITSFPWSTPGHDWLPAVWDFKVGIHFTHRIMALVLAIALPAFAIAIWHDAASTKALRNLALVLVALLIGQIGLGVEILHSLRNPYVTTGHVLVGALTLATTVLLTFLAHRDAIEAVTGTGDIQPSAEPAGIPDHTSPASPNHAAHA